MGAFCPLDIVQNDKDLREKIAKTVISRCIEGLRKDGFPYIGVIFAGLMITDKKDVRVLEYNCRFGDPETQSILPLLETDLYEIFNACINKRLDTCQINWRTESIFTCGVVIADANYPESTTKGQLIEGLSKATSPKEFSNPIDGSVYVIHAGTKLNQDNKFVTNGGRILTVIGCSTTLDKALSYALNRVDGIKISKSRHRSDIGWRSIARQIYCCAGDEEDRCLSSAASSSSSCGSTSLASASSGSSSLSLSASSVVLVDNEEQLATTTKATTALTYKACGVDIDKGNRFVDFVKQAVKTTDTSGVMSRIGSFGALFDMAKTGLEDPILVSGTDGVGTKLKMAIDCKRYDSVGIDLVAMCVNDILVHGAHPLFFLDYYACGSLKTDVAESVVQSIVNGCKQSNCALIGGETAEMPGMYHGDDIDLAGFAVGAVERSKMLPRMELLKPGDVVIGLSSTGIHSNGFSLVRRLVDGYDLPNPELSEILLKPTRIYVKQVMPAVEAGLIKSMAHITGGGLIENVPRSLPDNLCAKLDATRWSVLPIFAWIREKANMNMNEMLKTFNCGLGMVCIVDREHKDKVISMLGDSSVIGKTELADVNEVGELIARSGAGEKCIVDNLEIAFESAKQLARDIKLPSKSHGRRFHFKGHHLKRHGGRDNNKKQHHTHHKRHHGHDHVHHPHPHHHEHKHGRRNHSPSPPPHQGHRHNHGRHHRHHSPPPHHHGHKDDHHKHHHRMHHHHHEAMSKYTHYKGLGGSCKHHSEGHHAHKTDPHHKRHHDYHHGPHHHQTHHGHEPGHKQGRKEGGKKAILLRKHSGGDHLSDHHQLACQLQGMALEGSKCKSCVTKKVAIMLSGTGTNARAIMDYQRKFGPKFCGYEVALLVSNKSDAPGLKYAQEFAAETRIISHKDFKDRVSFDMRVNEILNEFKIDIICLAGFMRILSEEFVKLWSGKMINIHPSLLPSFKGTHAYKQALDAGVRLTGCSIHFVTAGVDEGAIILQDTIAVHSNDTEETLSERGKMVENQAYPLALRMLARGEVKYDEANNRAVFKN